MNIGDKVKYMDVYNELGVGVIMDVSSSMTSYDDMKFEDGVPYYVSKKMSVHKGKPVYVAVKPKNMDTVFLIIESSAGRSEFLSLNEVIVCE
jgi:hypothetical protein